MKVRQVLISSSPPYLCECRCEFTCTLLFRYELNEVRKRKRKRRVMSVRQVLMMKVRKVLIPCVPVWIKVCFTCTLRFIVRATLEQVHNEGDRC